MSDIDLPFQETCPPPPGGSAGLYGKLPARGDFVVRNLKPEMVRPLDDWLQLVLRDSRAVLAADWDRVWRQAPAWRFWIGASVLEGEWRQGFRGQGSAAHAAALTGVLLPSADRVGRHFPLMVLLIGRTAHLVPPPVLGHSDEAWYAACEGLLREARIATDLIPVEAALAALPDPNLPPAAEGMADLLARRALWAVGRGHEMPEGDLWADIASTDHYLAAAHRSYWWRAADMSGPGQQAAAAVVSLPGLPDPETFAFLLTGAQHHATLDPESPPESLP